LIGDEQEPADVKWDTKIAGLSSVKNDGAGYKLMEFPEWFTEGKPRPSAGAILLPLSTILKRIRRCRSRG
jgi:hypothetical protein